MTLVICLDDRGGMSFGGRRQSQDRVLRARVAELAKGHGLWMNSYSAAQFGDDCNISVSEQPGEHAEGGYCFVENLPASAFLPAEELVIYRWNRHYPSDKKFLCVPEECGFSKVSTTDFAGSSHEKITEEIYQKS